MNNASPSAGPGDPSSSSFRPPLAFTSGLPNMPAITPDDENATTAAAAAGASNSLHASARARDQLTTKKFEWLDHLLRNLDIVTYCHFSYLYFLDISFVRFLIRAIVQINLFAQRPPNFPTPQRSQKRSAVVSIFGSTLICFLFHVFSDPPEPSETTGGYLHGGMIIDFVGQEGPISRLRLIFLDVIILILQLLMLTAKVIKQDLLDNTSPNRTIPAQDLDSEERGVDATAEPNEEDIPLSPTDDHDELQTQPRRQEVNIYSGDIVVADLRIVETVKSQWNAGNSPVQASPSAALAANLANARLRMLFRR